jgi:hypothetical protein
LTAYERSLQGGNSSIVMQPDSEFFDYLRSDKARRAGKLCRSGRTDQPLGGQHHHIDHVAAPGNRR